MSQYTQPMHLQFDPGRFLPAPVTKTADNTGYKQYDTDKLMVATGEDKLDLH